MRAAKRDYSLKAVLLVVALGISVIALAIALFADPLSLDALDAFALCVAIFWYLAVSIADPEIDRSTGTVAALLAIIIALEIYTSFSVALFLYAAVAALSVLVVVDARHRTPELRLGYVACKDVLTGRAHIA